ncbi:MAG: beta-carotene 15,15'-dioxygenase, Brp/Blh family [Saprospiraceae bacterium]|nr:beta-carotene 15,15'-dioxygenase, Brp/Blh family [Saprospiraceae bacterium]
MPDHQPPFHIYDYIFCGLGASGSLVLFELDRRGMLHGKSILVFEPGNKSANDKTYCFWTTPDDPSTAAIQDIISNRWQKISVPYHAGASIDPLHYCRIRSIDLYEKANNILKNYKATCLQDSANTLENDHENVVIRTKSTVYHGKTVFDSRPPRFLVPRKNQVVLWQSFLGLEVSIDQGVIDTETVVLMDFNVPQEHHTQFMYVLPLSPNTALVELTRFGSDKILEGPAWKILETYLKEKFGNHTITGIERGNIPMVSAAIETPESLRGVITLGSRAGNIKPSTGYGFMKMLRHATDVGEALSQAQTPAAPTTPARFAFYDRLLLLVLCYWPHWGKPVFEQLFRKIPAPDVLKFLDEKTSTREDLSILLSLPFRPFLAALGIELQAHFSRYKHVLLPLILSAVSVLFPGLQPTVYFLLLTGLILVGLPHGALDHVVETGNIRKKITPGFIIRYLGKAAIMAGCWWLSPLFGVLLFVGYSAWHFGQTDYTEWQRNSKTGAFLWGLSLLFIILLTHAEELSHILRAMHIDLGRVPEQFGSQAMVAGLALLTLQLVSSLFAKNGWKQTLTLMTLLLGIKLPLLLCFGIYFIGQHSVSGWFHLRKTLQTTHREMLIKAAPFTLGALGMFAVAFAIAGEALLSWNHAAVFFIVLSCISFPHILGMHVFYQNKKQPE